MNPILLSFLKNKFNQFQKSCKNAQNIQIEYLKHVLVNNHHTNFGKEYDFKSIYQNFSISKFQKSIPIHNYISYQSQIESIMKGIPNVLTKEKVNFFNLTSGTTNNPKHIPVTRSFHNQSKHLLDTWIGGLLTDHPSAMDGFRLAIPGRAIETYSPSGVPIGSASGIAYKSAPWFIRNKYAVPYEVFEEEDFNLRYLLIVRSALTKDISFIATPNSGTILQLLDKLGESTDMILRSFYEGGFSIHEDKIRMNHLFKPNINVARRFEKNINLNAGKFNPLTYWENLKMISVWLGGSCGSQVTKLKEKFPSIPLRDLGFHASEARMSLPFRDNTSEGILAIHNNFYEFIPKNEYENEQYNCLQIDDLEAGKEYYILITNASGLYRYDLGDVIQVTGFYKEAPIIKFMRKNKDMSDLVGEKLHINHFLFAREQLKLELILNDERFIIYPSQDYNGYELFCEISDIENKEKINVLSKKFDDFLQIANWEYETKRKSQRINPLRLINIPKGTINSIVYGKFQMGMRDSQYKWNYFTNEQPIIND